MMDKITSGTRIRANPGHMLSTVRDEAVVLLLDSGEYFGLNAVGVRVWTLLQTEQAFGAILSAIVSEYEVAPDIAEHDLSDLIERLELHGLVERRDIGP